MQQSLGSSAPISYIYRFKHILSFDAWGQNYTFCVGVVCHGSELPFVFSVWSFIDEQGKDVEYYPTSSELTLATDMSDAWSNFMNSHNPNTGLSTFTFPEYKASEDKLIVLDIPGSEIQQNVRSSYCDFWDSVGYFF
jgi:carboxylesterase type B